MQKGLFRFILTVLALYVGLHLVLGSSPVQKRVLEELRQALGKFGLDFQMESIEFSAFTPKIYLNRVTVRVLPRSGIPLADPLPIDKIKIQFQPLALISRQLLIEEVTFFHPRIVVPNADQLIRSLKKFSADKGGTSIQNGLFTLVIKKMGVVDALLNVELKDPQVVVRSRSLSIFVQNTVTRQQNVTLQSTNLELERNKLRIDLTNVDLDLDVNNRSIRLNRGLIQGQQIAINVRGSSSLPLKTEKGLAPLTASYDVKFQLPFLNQFYDLGLPKLEGMATASGTVKVANGNYSGSGQVHYDSLLVEGYRIGQGSMNYALVEKALKLTDIKLKYAGGDLSSEAIRLDLTDRFKLSGELRLKGLRLASLIESLKSNADTVYLGIDGTLKFSGFMADPFEIKTDLKSTLENFAVVHDVKKNADDANTIVGFRQAQWNGTLDFFPDRMAFQTQLGVLGGKMEADGFIGFHNTAKISVKSENLSLSELRHISTLRIGGAGSISAEMDIAPHEFKLVGGFDLADAELSEVVLGSVKGQAHFQNALLSFENLEAMTTPEPVRGSGFVDFSKHPMHYKFALDTKRIELNQIFNVFQKHKLNFTVPTDGDVNSRISIEGGHDTNGIEVIASGQGKNFSWYGEKWLSSHFFVTYRPDFIDLNRVMLMKRSGGLEVGGRFTKNNSKIRFISHGLRVEELDRLEKAPIVGELVGDLSFEGDLTRPKGIGEVKLLKSAFRGTHLPDSSVKIHSEVNRMEILAHLFGDKLRGRLIKDVKDKERWELLLYFEDYDFAPLTMAFMGKDIPTLNDLTATGDLSISGQWEDWNSITGSGSITHLNLGLAGTPMKNRQPLAIQVKQGAIKVDRFNLIGKDGQISLDFLYQPNKTIRASLDGKLDLQFIQPFLPLLDSGSGKVSAGLRVSGSPAHYELLGNIRLEDGTFRLSGVQDEFRGVEMQLSVSQDRINVDRFSSTLSGGTLTAEGDVKIDKLQTFSPNLKLSANRVGMKLQNHLLTKLSGEFVLKGSEAPYLLGGKCKILEATLDSFEMSEKKVEEGKSPAIKFDVTCDAKEKLLVKTDIMDAEFRGNFHLLGTSSHFGITGNAEVLRGSMLFRETKFSVNTASVRFESPSAIAPRFTVSGTALVKEVKALSPREYEIGLQVFGTPADYKLRLTSSPALAEGDIISLILLGVTSRAREGDYMDLGTTLVGQVPIQSKIQNELGVGIKINQTTKISQTAINPQATTAQTTDFQSVPTVQIEKEISKKTKLSLSNTLETVPVRQLKIEHLLNDNLTVNGTAGDRSRESTDNNPVPSYGVDFRYRFNFE